MDYTQLLKEIENRLPDPPQNQNHNITLGENGNPRLNIYSGGGWLWVRLDEKDQNRAAENLAEKIERTLHNV